MINVIGIMHKYYNSLVEGSDELCGSVIILILSYFHLFFVPFPHVLEAIHGFQISC